MEQINQNQLEEIISRVEKPGRYIGGEMNSVSKDLTAISTHFCFGFPDTYEIGMSFVGLQVLYHILNQEKDIYCERVFSPSADMEAELRQAQLPLFTLESKTPVRQVDLLGITLQYELTYTNVLNLLDLSEIPLLPEDRKKKDPFVVGGGPCAFNPEPIADFFDAIVVGDGEEVILELCRLHTEWKRQGVNRNEFLLTISHIPGVYVPSLYLPLYTNSGHISAFEICSNAGPFPVQKAIVSDLDEVSYPSSPIVPLIDIVHDRSVLELFRGCTRGCRFCQAGMIYRPVRERSPERIIELADEQLKNTGYDELSLLSLSTSDYSCYETLLLDLVEWGKENDVSLSLPSLRLDSFSFHVLQEIQKYKKTSLTFAPEAGTQRLRDVINKTITDEDIYSAIEQAVSLGWTSVKFYFMIGLPTETMEDVDGIISIAKETMERYRRQSGEKKSGRFQLTVSVSNFVPKPHTPFQWAKQDTPKLFEEKHYYLKERLRSIRGVNYQYHDAFSSQVEAILARGDRRLASVIRSAWEKGALFDGWREHFNNRYWDEAIKEAGLDPDFYTSGDVASGALMPWSVIDSGISLEYLKQEWTRAKQEEKTPDCRFECNSCGINVLTSCPMEGTK